MLKSRIMMYFKLARSVQIWQLEIRSGMATILSWGISNSCLIHASGTWMMAQNCRWVFYFGEPNTGCDGCLGQYWTAHNTSQYPLWQSLGRRGLGLFRDSKEIFWVRKVKCRVFFNFYCEITIITKLIYAIIYNKSQQKQAYMYINLLTRSRSI